MIRTLKDSSGLKMQQQYYGGPFKANKPDGQGLFINEPVDLAKMMQKCGISLDQWNAFTTKIKATRELVTALRVKPNALETTEKQLTAASEEVVIPLK